MPRRISYLEEFLDDVQLELRRWNRIWGDFWLTRGQAGQVERARGYFGMHFDNFEKNGVPVKWQRLACTALEGYIRDKYTELFMDSKISPK